jgi:hypothetical protein
MRLLCWLATACLRRNKCPVRRQIIPPTRGAGGIFDSVGKLTPFLVTRGTRVEYLFLIATIIFWYQKEVGQVYCWGPSPGRRTVLPSNVRAHGRSSGYDRAGYAAQYLYYFFKICMGAGKQTIFLLPETSGDLAKRANLECTSRFA